MIPAALAALPAAWRWGLVGVVAALGLLLGASAWLNLHQAGEVASLEVQSATLAAAVTMANDEIETIKRDNAAARAADRAAVLAARSARAKADAIKKEIDHAEDGPLSVCGPVAVAVERLWQRHHDPRAEGGAAGPADGPPPRD